MSRRSFKKIAVLRASALGDFILTLPALQAIKEAYPEAEVTLLGRKLHYDFFEGKRGPLDRIIPIPKSVQFNASLFLSSEEKDLFLKKLQDENFDLLVQLHGGGKYSNAFARMVKAGLTIGARTMDAPALDINIPYTQFQHEVLRQFEIIRWLDILPRSINPMIEVDGLELNEAKKFLGQLSSSKSFVLINPGATDPRRRWPASEFAEVAQDLSEKGHAVLINLAPNEGSIGEEFNRALKKREDIFFISPELRLLTGILSLSQLVISNDTGTMHLAQALGRPTVSLFWYVNLLNYGPIVSTTNRVLVSYRTTCPACGKNALERPCEHPDSLVADIPRSKVLEEAYALLNKEEIWTSVV